MQYNFKASYLLPIFAKKIMINILLCIMAGIAVGYLARKRTVMKYTGSLLSVAIMLLLFFLGLSVGSNEQVVNNFTSIGLDAFLLTVGGTAGSLFCAKWVYKKFF
ncbi:MAG TPA: DUF340 domain-containing protein [Porphyromonadaceae bacterium]|nr:DUF340 domain-containing protein [Porphyromonadaceae bacterium]